MNDIMIPKLNNNDISYMLTDWLVAEGDLVRAGDAVATVETSKAANELLAPSAGRVRQRIAADSECRPGDVIGHIATEEDAGHSEPGISRQPADVSGVLLTDAARDLAAQRGIDDTQLRALGKKIIKRSDVERLSDAGQVGDAATDSDVVIHELPRVQRAVAANVTASHAAIPAAYTVAKIHVDELLAAKDKMAAQSGAFVGVTELLIKALAMLHADFPLFFSTLTDEHTAIIPATAHVGVTMDAGAGLFVPVVRDAAARSVSDIGRALMDFRTRALRGTLRDEDFRGGNIVLALNSQPHIVMAVPLIMPGHSCALSLGGIQEEVRLDPSGKPAVCHYVHVGVAYDHRVVNGRAAMGFLGRLNSFLISPAELLSDSRPASAP
jgi:2-oxoglutarate dehydrogenase E2 component (dihydrolipoamide succinyltransferase)